MSARVYSKKRVKDCKDVSIMSPQDEREDGQVYSVCILQFPCFTKYDRIQSKLNKEIVNNRRKSIGLQLSQWVSLY